MTIVNAIRSGQASSSIVLGPRGFLGVQVTALSARTASQVGLQITRGALVVEVVPGTPADQSGIPQYGAIVAIDGQKVTSADSLGSVLFDKNPGDVVQVTWTDVSGACKALSGDRSKAPRSGIRPRRRLSRGTGNA
jgi:S1-C subfamily serine protease